MGTLPYLPKDREILYVLATHEFMQAAQKYAKSHSSDSRQPTGAVLVKDGQIIGYGANYSWWHETLWCVRKLFRRPTGKGYWMCPGCSPRHHAEASAIRDAWRRGDDPSGADLYLWGHWWCCQHCWAKMIKADIKNVYLPEGANEKFK